MDALLILGGIVALYLGGEALVRGAVSLARASGLSPLVLGLTVVSFGTSSPELASTLAATFQGAPDVAFGNVVGSNIANIGLILGLTALIWPLSAESRFIRREVPFMLAASALLFWLIRDDVVGRLEGVLLLALLVLFLVYLFHRDSREEPESGFEEYAGPRGSIWRSVVLVLMGLGLLVIGANALVVGAVSVARAVGISERVIGLTMVALGTSLPELASSIVAAVRRHSDIVLGNIIGSNVFNILCILGATAAVRPVRVEPDSVWVDLAVMMGISVLVWPFLKLGMRLRRWEGLVLLLGYIAYTVSLFY